MKKVLMTFLISTLLILTSQISAQAEIKDSKINANAAFKKLEAGTILKVRLQEPVGTAYLKTGAPFTVVVLEDIKEGKKIDPDIVYAACILHDFGKIFEYKTDLETGIISYNNDFIKDWISHSQWGFSLCMSKGYKDIAKMIAAHHGRTEWGAIIDLDTKDLEPFIYLIHHIDDLSAKFGKTSINDLEDGDSI